MNKKKERLHTRDSEQVEPPSETTETPGETPIPYPKTEQSSDNVESKKAGLGEQEIETLNVESGAGYLSSGGSDEAGTENSQRRNMPLGFWSLAVTVGFLIAVWLMCTYVLNTPAPATQT